MLHVAAEFYSMGQMDKGTFQRPPFSMLKSAFNFKFWSCCSSSTKYLHHPDFFMIILCCLLLPLSWALQTVLADCFGLINAVLICGKLSTRIYAQPGCPTLVG